MEKKQAGLLEGSAAFFVSSLIIYGARFATSVIVARTLGVEGKGTYTLVLMVGSLLSLFLSFGLSGSITYLAASQHFTAKELFSFSIISSMALSVIGGVLFYFAYIGMLSTSFLAGTDITEIGLVVAILPINLLTLFLSSILLGKQQIFAYNLTNILRVVSNLGLQAISSLLSGSILGAILAWFASNIIAFGVTLWLLRDEFSITIHLPRNIIRPAFSFGTKNYIANLFTFFNYRLDSFLVNYYSGTTSVGLYSIGVSTAELVWYIPNAISSALFPKSSALDRKVSARLTAQACRQTFLVATFLTMSLAILGPLLIPIIYGPDFRDSVSPFLWLLPGILGVSLSKIISANLSGLGKPQFATYTAGITVIITLALDVILIPVYDIVGAAVASSIAYIVSAILSVYWFSQEANINVVDVIIPKPEDLTILIKRISIMVNGWRT